MHLSFGRVLVLVTACVSLAACGSQSGSDETPDGTVRASTEASGQPSGEDSGGCPLTPDDLAQATSLTWELGEKKDDHPLETVESVTATVCVYTSADAPQAGGDPLVLRADIVAGPGAAVVRKSFTDTCAENGGEVRTSAAGAALCERSGVVVEGLIGGTDRVTDVYLVNADTATATNLTPAFEKILAAVNRGP
jgi:hypothetical protein